FRRPRTSSALWAVPCRLMRPPAPSVRFRLAICLGVGIRISPSDISNYIFRAPDTNLAVRDFRVKAVDLFALDSRCTRTVSSFNCVKRLVVNAVAFKQKCGWQPYDPVWVLVGIIRSQHIDVAFFRDLLKVTARVVPNTRSSILVGIEPSSQIWATL